LKLKRIFHNLSFWQPKAVLKNKCAKSLAKRGEENHSVLVGNRPADIPLYLLFKVNRSRTGETIPVSMSVISQSQVRGINERWQNLTQAHRKETPPKRYRKRLRGAVSSRSAPLLGKLSTTVNHRQIKWSPLPFGCLNCNVNAGVLIFFNATSLSRFIRQKSHLQREIACQTDPALMSFFPLLRFCPVYRQIAQSPTAGSRVLVLCNHLPHYSNCRNVCFTVTVPFQTANRGKMAVLLHFSSGTTGKATILRDYC
jgi:hypothetical protein